MGKFREIFTELSARDTPIFRFRMITLVNNKGFSSNLLYVLTVRRSGLELLIGTFRQIFTEVSPRHVHIFISG